jgi:dihydroorotate dehydrogenase electron transfer subunit
LELSIRKEPKATVLFKQTWKNYCLLGLGAEAIAQEAQPGQFIMVRPNENSYPLLRRPFSIHSTQNGSVEIFFQKVGPGSIILSRKEQGDSVDILGPLGKGFSLGNSLEEKPVALIGGGRGIAPLYFLALKLRRVHSLPRIFYGGKTLADIPLKHKFEEANFEVLASTDDGAFGFKGLVTELFQAELKRYSPTRIYACGPEAMMQKIDQIARERNIPTEFSLESIMGCGFGACWGCVRKIKSDSQEGWKKICEEGPVFPGHQIIWREEES